MHRHAHSAHNAIDHLLTLEYIPAPLTIFETIYKLPAGHTLTFDEHGVSETVLGCKI